MGLPLESKGKLYNVAAVLQDGKILAFIPKASIPNYGEFYEARHFAPWKEEVEDFLFDEVAVPFGTHILLSCDAMEGLGVACEIC